MSTPKLIELNSAFRNRNQFQNPANFDVLYTSAGPQNTPGQAHDFVSIHSPKVNANMLDMFDATSSPIAPYFWYKLGTIVFPTVSSTVSSFTITLSSPDFPDNSYTGLVISYNDGVTTYIASITSFINLHSASTYFVSFDTPIPFNILITACQLETQQLTSTLLYIPYTTENVINITNAYIGQYVLNYDTGEIARIIAYNADSRILTLETMLATIPTRYIIQSGNLSNVYTVQTTPAVNQITITYNAPRDPLLYQYIYDLNTSTTYKIIAVAASGSDTLLTLNSSTTLAPGDFIDLLFFSYDGEVPLICIGANGGMPTSPICYDIQLVSIQIPNIYLGRYPGGLLVNYPYVTIELTNTTTPGQAAYEIYTNDPNMNQVLFVCPVVDISTPGFASFLKLTSGVAQSIKFKPNDTLHFEVRLPDGQPIQFEEEDTMPPFPPNPFVQITAIFSIAKSRL